MAGDPEAKEAGGEEGWRAGGVDLSADLNTLATECPRAERKPRTRRPAAPP